MDTAAQEAGVETTIREDSRRIGKFALTARLGKGSSGTVYKALDTFSGQEVALKVLDESLFSGQGINEMSRQQFMNEASLAGRLQHPHIASILEACIDEKSGYIAVEYVAGGDLARAVLPEGAALLFLASGEVKIVKHGRLLNVLRTGSYFGEMAHVKAGSIPRQATVETMTEALIAEFRPGAMKKLSINCQLQLSLLNTVVDRLAFADERIAHA